MKARQNDELRKIPKCLLHVNISFSLSNVVNYLVPFGLEDLDAT